MARERGTGQGEERAQAKDTGWECGSAGGYRGSLPSQGRERNRPGELTLAGERSSAGKEDVNR